MKLFSVSNTNVYMINTFETLISGFLSSESDCLNTARPQAALALFVRNAGHVEKWRLHKARQVV